MIIWNYACFFSVLFFIISILFFALRFIRLHILFSLIHILYLIFPQVCRSESEVDKVLEAERDVGLCHDKLLRNISVASNEIRDNSRKGITWEFNDTIKDAS